MNIKFLDLNFEIGEDYIFSLPFNLYKQELFGYFLIISPENGSWLVLNNKLQVDIFDGFHQKKSISEILCKYSNNLEDIKFVVAKILGKHLESVFDRQHYSETWTLRLYLTNKCNLRCKHCFMFSGKALEKELSKNEVLETIRVCQHNGAGKVVFTGGEVLLSDAFLPALIEAKKLNLNTQVLTNGTLWNDVLIKETSPYIDHIQISVDGFNEYTNAQIRGSGSFDKAMRTIYSFVSKNVNTSMAMTPTYELLCLYENKYVKFAQNILKELGDNNFSIAFTNELLKGRNISVSTEENKKYAEITSRILEQIYPNYALTTFVRKHKHNNVLLNCGYGFLTLDSNGDFSFCSNNSKKYGNIRLMSWEKIFSLRKKARSCSMIDAFVPCNKCDLRFICGGGCRQHNMPEVTKIDNLNEIQSFVGKVMCDIKYKNNLYKQMIESDDFLMW